MDKETLQKLILETVEELMSRSGGETPGVAGEEPSPAPEEVRDLSAVDFRNIISVPHPCQPELFQEWRAKSTARIGIWRAGPRYRTESYLRFRADHAAAMDAVAKDVPREILEEMGLFQVQTICQSKDEYLTQPDRGRLFSPETMEAIRKNCVAQPDVQLVVADGLSSTAIPPMCGISCPPSSRGWSSAGCGWGPRSLSSMDGWEPWTPSPRWWARKSRSSWWGSGPD